MEIKKLRNIKLDYGLSINYILKDQEISKIFKLLENKIENIILKGGTGINRVYVDKENRRFSEDIDFDIISRLDINTIKKKLYKNIKNILTNYKVDKPRIMNKTIRYDVHYVNKINKKDKIRLEFRIKREVNKKKICKKIVDYGFVPFKTSLYSIYTCEELINQKLFAYINRREGKDIYDLFYLLNLEYNKENIDIKKVNKSIIKTKEILDDKKLIKYITNSTNHYIRKELRNDFEIFLKELLRKLKKIKGS